jgi:hypothetical protein
MNLVVATQFLTINGQYLFALVTWQERKTIAIHIEEKKHFWQLCILG